MDPRRLDHSVEMTDIKILSSWISRKVAKFFVFIYLVSMNQVTPKLDQMDKITFKEDKKWFENGPSAIMVAKTDLRLTKSGQNIWQRHL